MYTKEALLDLHERGHRSLRKLLEHCRDLDADQLNRELPGFGYATVRLQLHHVIGAQEYWFNVIARRPFGDDNDHEFLTVASLEAYRENVFAVVEEHLRTDDMNTPHAYPTWGGNEPTLVPAHVFMRTLTHIYQHQGQIAAMCRLLGKPVPAGLDFPLL